MPCSRPLTVWPSLSGGPHSFKPGQPGHSERGRLIRCGQCPYCKGRQALETSVRASGEYVTHDGPSCYLTLTYSPERVKAPMGKPTLWPDHLRLFWEELRRSTKPRTRVRYLACGEYGEKTSRPHYHAIVFGWRPTDLVFHGTSHTGHPMWISTTLDELWGLGQCYVQNVNVVSIQYVAGYVQKKLFGTLGAHEYSDKFPPFVVQSQSLGRDYLMKYLWSDVMSGTISLPTPDGHSRQVPVPRAWIQWLERHLHWVNDPAQHHTEPPYVTLKRERAEQMDDQYDDGPHLITYHENASELNFLARLKRRDLRE